MAAWTIPFAQIEQKILSDINKRVNEIAWHLFESVVKLTPSPSNPGKYAQGLLANQWYARTGSPSSELGTRKSATGGDSLARAKALTGNNAEFFGRDGKVYLSNNLDYAHNAETIGWPKPQWSGNIGPYGMVTKSLILTAAKYNRVKI